MVLKKIVILSQLPLSVNRRWCARALSPSSGFEQQGHVSTTAAAGTVAPQWKHWQLLRSCAQQRSGIRSNNKRHVFSRKPPPVMALPWRDSALFIRSPRTPMQSIFAPWNTRLTPWARETRRGTEALMCWNRNGRPWFVTAANGGAIPARGARAGAIGGWVNPFVRGGLPGWEKVNGIRRPERVCALDTCIRFKPARVCFHSVSGDLGFREECIL